MPIRKLYGELEVDTDRGVVYFHVDPEQMAAHCLEVNPNADVTVLRICQLNIPDQFLGIDITHGWGVSYKRDTGAEVAELATRTYPGRSGHHDKTTG